MNALNTISEPETVAPRKRRSRARPQLIRETPPTSPVTPVDVATRMHDDMIQRVNDLAMRQAGSQIGDPAAAIQAAIDAGRLPVTPRLGTVFATTTRDYLAGTTDHAASAIRGMIGKVIAEPTIITLADVDKMEAFLASQVAHAMRSIREIVARDPGTASKFSFDMDMPSAPRVSLAERIRDDARSRLPVSPVAAVAPSQAPAAAPAAPAPEAPQAREASRYNSGIGAQKPPAVVVPIGRLVGSKAPVYGEPEKSAPASAGPDDEGTYFLSAE